MNMLPSTDKTLYEVLLPYTLQYILYSLNLMVTLRLNSDDEVVMKRESLLPATVLPRTTLTSQVSQARVSRRELGRPVLTRTIGPHDHFRISGV